MNQDLDPRYQEARCHVRRLRGFYSHATTYVCVIGALLLANLLLSPGRLWVQWTAFGWGIGLLAHGVSVLAFRGAFGRTWEERKIREYLERSSR
jgi:two-component system, LytTR family, sensor kinase